MDIRQLRYFIAIADSRSLSEAAGKLNIAQPSLSQHLANIERELGVKLVVRSPRGSFLSSEGRILLRHAHEICGLLSHCLASMKELSEQASGTVRFAMSPSSSMVISVPLAERVRAEMPQIKLCASEATSSVIKTWLREETVEIGLLHNLEGVERFAVSHVLTERLFFFAAPDAWPLQTAPGIPVPLRDLQGLELVLPAEPHGLRRLINRAAGEAGIRLNIVTELNALTQIRELVARGTGYAILASGACDDFVETGRLTWAPIVDPGLQRPVYLVRNPNLPQTRACAAVEQIICTLAAERVERGIWNT